MTDIRPDAKAVKDDGLNVMKFHTEKELDPEEEAKLEKAIDRLLIGTLLFVAGMVALVITTFIQNI